MTTLIIFAYIVLIVLFICVVILSAKVWSLEEDAKDADFAITVLKRLIAKSESGIDDGQNRGE